jgi:phosphatidylglycerophosphatase A
MSAPTEVPPRRVFSSPVLLLAFGLGAGLSPKAPGTVGTLVAVPLYLLFSQWPAHIYLGLTLAVALAGVWICGEASRQLEVKDHPGIVWDEVAGFLVTMVAVSPSLFSVAAGFALFRLFDIWKPWPVRWADRRLGGGLGVMLDDLLAGALAALVLAALVRGSGLAGGFL